MSQKLAKALDGAIERSRRRTTYRGTVGRRLPSGEWQFTVAGRPECLWVMMRLSTGGQTAVPAINTPGVKHAPKLEVEMRKEGEDYVILGKSSKYVFSKPSPSDPSGNEPHLHDHGAMDGLGDDDHTQYHTDVRGDARYFREDEHVSVSTGALDAGKPAVLGPTGVFDESLVPPVDIAGEIDASTENTVLDDGDHFAQTVAGVLRWISGANLKAALTTLFDGLYGRLAAANTWLQNQIITSAATSGSSLSVTRNLAAASTDAPVVSILQEHATDDQAALQVRQNGTGDIVAFLDGPTKAFYILNSGKTVIGSSGTVANATRELNLVGTDSVLRILRISADSTTAAPAVELMHRVTAGGADDVFWDIYADTNGLTYRDRTSGTNPRLRIDTSGNVGIYVASPQGKVHVHDGTTGHLIVSKTGIVGAAQTILPDGAGDVVYGVIIRGVARNSTPGVAEVNSGLIVPGGTYDLVIGADTLRFAVSAGGAVTVIRQAGSATWIFGGTLTWI